MTDNNPSVPEETIKSIVESGVAFPDESTAEVSVEARFIESGNQLQQVFIGLEPVLLVQPEYDADAHEVKFVTTAVDLDPRGLVDVLEVLLDAARETRTQQEEMLAEQAGADSGLRAANDAFEAQARAAEEQ